MPFRRRTLEILSTLLGGSTRIVLNEAVNMDKRVIFIAVPKTGSTSVRDQLREDGIALIPNPHLDIRQVRDALYLYFLRTSLGGNKEFPSRGTPSDDELREKARQTFESFFKFSSVRNPWARAVSLYFRREGVQASDQMSFDTFCEQHIYASDTCEHPTLHASQLDWLCDESGQVIMDYVFKVEEFQKAIDDIRERTDGRLKLTYRESNTNPQSRSASYRDLYSEKTRKMIAKRFEKDIDYFRYAF